MSSEDTHGHRSGRPPSAAITVSLLIAAYALLVILHIYLLHPYFQAGIGAYFSSDGVRTIGNFVGDEASYRVYAESLRHFDAYPAEAAYPPGYPVLLALAELLYPADPIEAMIVANIAVASAVMFPVYALARQMLARDWAFGAALVAGLLPASFVFAPALMSENLFTTIFAIAFWLTMRQRPSNMPMAGLSGATLAACFLTKFLFLVMIPFLGTASIVNQLQMTSRSGSSAPIRSVARQALVAVIVGAVLVTLWSVYLVASGGTVAQSLGYRIATVAFNGPKGWQLPPLRYIPPILGLNGLALAASVLPLLPAVLAGIFARRPKPLLLYVILLGAITVFIWLFVTVYGWFALLLYDYPQPIYQRYAMMLVPICVPLAFVGLKEMLDGTAARKMWRALAMAGLISLALARLAQAGLYDRTIWPVPEWITVIWVGAPDVLYGALGFPVIVVTAVAVGALAAIRLAGSFGRGAPPTRQRILRLGVIAAATAGLAVFQVKTGLAGTHFAWGSPFLAINAAHARAITAIIGDRSRDRRRAVLSVEPAVFDTIENSTGIRLNAYNRSMNLSTWWMNLSFWSGRQVFVMGPENPLANKARYFVSLAHPGADPATVYRIGVESFQVQIAPDR